MTGMEEELVPGGALADVPVGRFLMVLVHGRKVGLTRLPGGELRAVRDRCPHKGAEICRGIIGGTWPPSAPGELAFGRDGEVLVCPWHGFEYDLVTGEEMYQPRPTRLLTLPVEVRDGQVLIRAPRPRLRARQDQGS
jgi:nitrite reductase/ring-hydroxylating ferredoxin subunit